MISFIIIGKNIETTAERCFKSVNNFIEKNQIKAFEIIYVDSDSKDKTIEIAKKFSLAIYQIKGEANAAIGRNVGVEKSKGDTLFFIDGDMEIMAEFYPVAFDNDEKLKYPFVSGDFINKYFDNQMQEEDEMYRYGSPLKEVQYSITTGGLFLIDRRYWYELGGMDERLKRNQDIDFGLRMLEKHQLKLKIYNNLLAIHNTSRYHNIHRFMELISNNYLIFYGIIIRKHFMNPQFIKLLLRSRYSIFFLLFSFYNAYILIFYVLLQLSKIFFSSFKNRESFLLQITLRILNDLFAILGIFYFPKVPKYKIQKIL